MKFNEKLNLLNYRQTTIQETIDKESQQALFTEITDMREKARLSSTTVNAAVPG